MAGLISYLYLQAQTMITIISGTNRQDSETEKVAAIIYDLVNTSSDEEVKLLVLTDLPLDFISSDMYRPSGQHADITSIQNEFMLPADKFWFVFPEYNGGVPGILKLFLDALSVRSLAETFRGKKACLTGISTGRAGNLRGLDHLTNILNYLQVIVYPNRLPISSISNLKDDDGVFKDRETLQVLNLQLKEFLAF
ncbi:MAG: NAD(P)H-dependent oxidoreductase [Saprospiraceae bacterium]|nr:NAD(P)H-dependent oxidoreductase [Saprospiraceae bacterium]